MTGRVSDERDRVMGAVLLEGKPVAEKLRASLASEVSALKAAHGRAPRLAALQIGEDASSTVYIRNQKKTSEVLGIEYALETLDGKLSQSDAELRIGSLNADPAVTGIIVQLPVPKALDAGALASVISPSKDVEGINPCNLGNIVSGKAAACPCTAMAVMALLESSGVDLYGREAVVVGHSNIVGKPLALMLMSRFATTTVCHIATAQRGALAEHVKRAEVLIVAVGKPGVVKGEWIRPGAVVIDVGINRVGDRIVGDVEFGGAAERASYITPVPGGVGPLTTMMLMRNVVELFRRQVTK